MGRVARCEPPTLRTSDPVALCSPTQPSCASAEKLAEKICNDNIGKHVPALKDLGKVKLVNVAHDLEQDDTRAVSARLRSGAPSQQTPRKLEVKSYAASDKIKYEAATERDAQCYEQRYMAVGLSTSSVEQTDGLLSGAIEGVILTVHWERLLCWEVYYLPAAWLRSRGGPLPGGLKVWRLSGVKHQSHQRPTAEVERDEWLHKWIKDGAVFVRRFTT